MHGLARILSLMILHSLEKSHEVSDLELSSRQVFKGANLFESLLVIKARAHSNFEPNLDWAQLESLWLEVLERVGSSREKQITPTRQLIPSKPVIKPTERRKRKRR